MKKRKSIRFKVSDFLVLLFCLSGAATSLYFFWQDINKIQLKENEKPIATITFKQNTAQRKMADRVVWDRLQRTSSVYNGDYLRTSQESEATLTFTDGNAIDLFENTMIQVFITNNIASVSMDIGGNIALSSTAESTGMNLISSDGTKIEVEAGTSLNAQSTDFIAVQVSNGNATVISSSGQKIEATSGEKLEVKKDGNITVAPFSVIAPEKNSRLLKVSSSNPKVLFNWKIAEAENEQTYSLIRLETASDKDFTKNVKSKDYAIDDFPSVAFNLGTTFWKVTPILNDIKGNANSGKVTVFDCPAPTLRAPVAKTNTNYRLTPPVIPFIWKGNDTATSYKLEIASNPEMSNPVLSRITYSEAATVSEIGEGTWYWRIVPQYSISTEENILTSEVREFTISQKLELDPPTLTIPSQDEKIVLLPQTDDISQNVYFSWKTDSSAISSTITIYSDVEMTNPIFTKETSNNYISLPLDSSIFAKGNLYWTVSQIDDMGFTSQNATPRTFSLVEPSSVKTELLFPPENYTVSDKLLSQLEFVWKAPRSTKKSVFQVSHDKDFTDVVINNEIDSNTILNVELSSGKWYWKTDNSDIRSFTVSEALNAPQLIQPRKNEEFCIGKSTPIHFSWNNVPNASFYKLKITQNGNEESLFETSNITDTQATVTIPLPTESANYSWTVEAERSESMSSTKIDGKVAVGNFAVRTPYPTKLISPANNEKIDGLQALQKPVVLTWKSDDPVTLATLTLEKVLSNGRTQKIKVIRNPLQSESFTRLEQGTYRWNIEAQSSENYSMNSQTNTFTITERPLLPSPSVVTPKKDTVFDLDYLRNNRTINFSWKSVSRATEYKFSLYEVNKGSANRQIVETTIPSNTTSYTIDDISILNNGTFVWRITPIRKASDGFVEQEGRFAENSFKINIPLPKDPKIKNTGKQYGE